jgi:hypothetical protein
MKKQPSGRALFASRERAMEKIHP